jgi:OOP family OmpA-OmpF porin
MTPGYRTAVVSPYVADLGVRYMFNNKFGLKLILINSFTEGDNSTAFDTKYYRVIFKQVAT